VAVPVVLPIIIVPLPDPPKASALVVPITVPARIVSPPVKVLVPERVNAPVPEEFWITPVTLLPMTALMMTAPLFVIEVVTVPVLLMEPEENVIGWPSPFEIVRLLVPVTPPLKVMVPYALPMVNVPVVVEANIKGLEIVPLRLSSIKLALLPPPALLPKVMVLVPTGLEASYSTVPALIVKPPVKVLVSWSMSKPDVLESLIIIPSVLLVSMTLLKVTVLATRSISIGPAVEFFNWDEISCVLPEAYCKVPVPPKVMLPLESAPLTKFKMPALMFVPPVYELLASDSISVPVPIFVNVNVPLPLPIRPEKVSLVLS